MDYPNISRDTISHLYNAYASLQDSSLSKELQALLELRVSQINGCKYCCVLHKTKAIKLGITTGKINSLEQFIDSNDYTDAEKEALSWVELLTKLDNIARVEETKLNLYFGEREIVDITICIALMNTFNRLAISMRDKA
jgi:AhpD family alkylhydroperoxidase